MLTTTNRCRLLVLMAVVLLAACRKEQVVERNISSDMLAAVNALRSTGCTCGIEHMPPVKALQWNDTLAAAALAHARDMEANHYFSHLTPGGTAPIQRALALGYSGNYVTENIARGFAAIEPLLQAWRQSEAHCKAMMDSLQTHMGAANAGTYWVQEFGSSR